LKKEVVPFVYHVSPDDNSMSLEPLQFFVTQQVDFAFAGQTPFVKGEIEFPRWPIKKKHMSTLLANWKNEQPAKPASNKIAEYAAVLYYVAAEHQKRFLQQFQEIVNNPETVENFKQAAAQEESSAADPTLKKL